MSSPYKTFACYTFGCKVNFADSSSISRELNSLGFTRIHNNNIADIYLINTCSVTAIADKKTQKLIRKLNNRSPNSRIIVTGCYAQLKPKEIINIPGVDLVVGMEDKLNVRKYFYNNKIQKGLKVNTIKEVKDFKISFSLSERTRAFLKIQDGCNYSCSFCTIPNARGKSRSNTIYNTLKEMEKISNTGIKEIVLSGINIGDFGINHNEKFITLLKAIEKNDLLSRYRISSIEPNLIDSEITSILSKSKKWAQHLHIPLQSGSDAILKIMKRRYSSKYYVKLINKVRKKIPNICIGADVIVGFPGESDADFNKTYNLLKKVEVSYLHVFSYSKRDNTVASHLKYSLSKEKVKNRRVKLQKLSDILFKKHIMNNIGCIRNVLFQSYQAGFLKGLTDNYINVYVKGEKEYLKQIKNVKITHYNDLVFGEIID